jgi:hypothetical protein
LTKIVNVSAAAGQRDVAAGWPSLTQMTLKATIEQARAITGPNVNIHTMPRPAMHSPATAAVLRHDKCARHARRAQYPIHGSMARRITIHANPVMPLLNAPDTSRIIAIRPTAPAVAPIASLRMPLGIRTPDLVPSLDGHHGSG